MTNQTPQQVDKGEKLTVLMQVQISPVMADRLDAIELKHGITRSAFTRLAITERLERYEALEP